MSSQIVPADLVPAYLIWEEPCAENNYCHVAHTKIGIYYIHIDGGKHHALFDLGGLDFIGDDDWIGGPSGDIFTEQRKCQEHYNKFALSLFIALPEAESRRI